MQVPVAFWDRLAAAPAAILALDYDGTLAPFRTRRDAAVPYPGVTVLMDRIRREASTRVVLLSGRPPQEVTALLGLEPPPEVWGCHGWERLAADGTLTRQPLPEAVTEALTAAHRDADSGGWAGRLEKKYASLALHWRDAPEPLQSAAAARTILEPHTAGPDLKLLSFSAGLELRCPLWHKGRALSEILAEASPDAVCAYLGDDHTDEDAFTVLAGTPGGLPLLVAATDRPSAAAGRLTPPDDLLAFLTRWLETRTERKP